MFTGFAYVLKGSGGGAPRSPKKHTHIHTECSVARVISQKVVREGGWVGRDFKYMDRRKETLA